MQVAVLMSTYNGEKYIREQIDSILSQIKVNVTLFIRDDGSTDSTVKIITQYTEKYSNIKLWVGENIGVGNSFMQLLYSLTDEFDYYSFSDQDDIWLNEKLERAIEKISKNTVPTLYVSNQILVDKNGRKLGMRYVQKPDLSYMQTLSNNKATGCTMLWNKALNDRLTDINARPSKILLDNRIHDVWISAVAGLIGEIVYDQNGYILYRQHENNVVGVKKITVFGTLKSQIEKLVGKKPRNGRSMLAYELIKGYPETKYENLLVACANSKQYRNKWIIIHSRKEIIKHTNESQIGFALKVLMNFF